jgi:hypothetical protein
MRIGYLQMTVTPYTLGRDTVKLRLDMQVDGKTYGCIEEMPEPSFKSYFRHILDRMATEVENTILKEAQP